MLQKRGISNERVCVLIAWGRDKITFSKTSGMSRWTNEQLDKAIRHKPSKDDVLCTDDRCAAKTYVNEKRWMHWFNGVANKYLNNYLLGFKS